MNDQREMRPMYRETGNARPQAVAALLKRMAPALERRYPGCRSRMEVDDAEGRCVGFKPHPDCPVYGRRKSSAGMGHKSLADAVAIQRAADARFRRLTMRPGQKTVAELQLELKQRMATWR